MNNQFNHACHIVEAVATTDMTRREHRPAISKVQSEPTQACINDYPRILNVRFKAVNRTVLGLEFSSTYGSKQPLEPCLRWLEKKRRPLQ